MIIYDNVRDEKLQYDSKRVAAKISSLSSGQMDKYEYLTGEEMSSLQQDMIIQETKFSYSLDLKILNSKILNEIENIKK